MNKNFKDSYKKFYKELLKDEGVETEDLEIFGASEEGRILPGGEVEESGSILTKEGRIYHYWLGWDPEKRAPDGSKGYYTLNDKIENPITGEVSPGFREATLDEYKEFQEELDKGEDSEFTQAAKELGIKKLNPSREAYKFEERMKESDKIVENLLKEKFKDKKFIVYDRYFEKVYLPGDIPKQEGEVLTENGKIYHYELVWDKNKISPQGEKGYYSLGENYINPKTGKKYPKFYEVPFSQYCYFQEDLDQNLDPLLKEAMKNLNVKSLHPFKEKPYKKVLKDLEKKKEKMKKKIEKFIKKKKIFEEKFIIYDFFAEDDEVFSQENFPSFGKVLTKDGKIYEFEANFINNRLNLKISEIPLERYLTIKEEIKEDDLFYFSLKKAAKKLKIKKLYPFQKYTKKEIEKLLKEREEKAKKIIKELLQKEKKVIKKGEEITFFDFRTRDKELPSNLPECSGKVLTKEGKIFEFYLTWDKNKLSPDGKKGYFTLEKKPKTKRDYLLSHLYKFKEIPKKDYFLYQEELDENKDTEFTKAAKKLGVKKLYPFREEKK